MTWRTTCRQSSSLLLRQTSSAPWRLGAGEQAVSFHVLNLIVRSFSSLIRNRYRLEEMAAPYYILKKKVLLLFHSIHSSSRTCLLPWQSLLCAKRELPAPNCMLRQGFEPIIASPAGGKIPLDPRSTQEEQLSATSKNFLKDSERLTSNSPAYQPISEPSRLWPVGMHMTYCITWYHC